jgi:hypothetical protein
MTIDATWQLGIQNEFQFAVLQNKKRKISSQVHLFSSCKKKRESIYGKYLSSKHEII